jgi:dihydroorotase
MTILVRKATIKDINSSHNNQQRDVLISNGVIVEIAENIQKQADKILEAKGQLLSPGWVDMFVTGNDPGFEFKDDLTTTSKSAAKGGFTHVFLTPNTQPVVQNKSSVQYVSGKKTDYPVQLHPIGAITKNTEGKELTEMVEMKLAGAVAFGDGKKSVQSAGLLIKALQYVKAFDGIVIQIPDDQSVAPHGLMNEGVISTQVGLPGKPALAEEIMVARDIELARYTNSKLHITGITLAKSVEMIKKAKSEGLNITCSTTMHHLVFTENELLKGYNTNFKLNPPLRSENDRLALVEGVKNGTIDCISSHHTPQNKDAKVCEFEYAGYGVIGLQAAFGVLNGVGLNIDQILEAICYKPKQIFQLESKIEVGAKADLTLFDLTTSYLLTKETLASKSENSPYLGQTLTGKVIATIQQDKLHINP